MRGATRRGTCREGPDDRLMPALMSAAGGKAVAIAVGVIIAIEALLVLHVLGLGSAPLQVHDYRVYDRLAINLLDHRTFSEELAPPYAESYFRTPGYPAFIAAVYALSGRQFLTVRIAQFIVLGLTALLLYSLARRYFSERVAAISALLCATYPPLVFMSAMYTAETVSTCLLVGIAIVMADLQRRRNGLGAAFAAGLLIAVLALIRGAFSLFVFAAALAIIAMPKGGAPRTLRDRLRIAALICAGYAVVIAPWVVRNSRLVGRLTGPGASGGWSLYVSAQQWSGELSYRLLKPEFIPILADFNSRVAAAGRAVPASSVTGTRSLAAVREWYADRLYARDAKAKWRAIPPQRFLLGALPRAYWLWSTSDVSPANPPILHRLIQIWHVLLVALAAGGLILCRRRLAAQMILWIPAVYLTLLHFVFHVEPRYTVSARPLVWIYAAVAAEWLATLRAARGVRATSAAFWDNRPAAPAEIPNP